MKTRLNPKTLPPTYAHKAPTGIAGLDEITGGGWPRGNATLIEGGPGSGKTVLALQSLVNGARWFNEPGIFVAFEESSIRLVANAAKFGWDLPALQKKKLFFLDAQPKADLIQSGTFDLTGMLAILAAKADEMGAKRIVFDAVDMVLTLLNDPRLERQEVQWLLAREMTALRGFRRLTAVGAAAESSSATALQADGREKGIFGRPGRGLGSGALQALRALAGR